MIYKLLFLGGNFRGARHFWGDPYFDYYFIIMCKPKKSVRCTKQTTKLKLNKTCIRECSIIKASASFIDFKVFKVGVSLGNGFVLLLVVLDSFSSKE